MEIKTGEKTCVIGFAGKEPEMKFSSKGDAVTNLSVATGSDKYLKWYEFTFWGKAAEKINQGKFKGLAVMGIGQMASVKKYPKTAGGFGWERKLTVRELFYTTKGSENWIEIELPKDLKDSASGDSGAVNPFEDAEKEGDGGGDGNNGNKEPALVGAVVVKGGKGKVKKASESQSGVPVEGAPF